MKLDQDSRLPFRDCCPWNVIRTCMKDQGGQPSLIPRLSHILVSSPDPSPEKWKEGLVFWATFLVTWGGVKRHKECNYCIPRARALHCRHTRSRARWRSAIWFELSDRGAVTRKVVQNTRPSFSHVRGGAGHETTHICKRPKTGTGKALKRGEVYPYLKCHTHWICWQQRSYRNKKSL